MSKVEFYRHQLGKDETAAWLKTIETLFLTLGPEVAAFEKELGEYLVRDRENSTGPLTAPPYVIGTNSCSMGLILALKAVGLEAGDEVITTSMTFVSTVNAILHLGAKPVLVDVERGTGLIDPTAVLAAITPRTKGILPVHLYGQLADMRALRKIANAYSLFIVEDSAHGFEMERDSVRPGDLSDCAVFSFYATKNITSGDGGAITTRNQSVSERLRRLRNHGVSKAATDRKKSSYEHWDAVEIGYKANLTDLDASLLRIQLPKAEEKRQQRARLADRYRAMLTQEIPGIELNEKRGQSANHLFTIHSPPQNPLHPKIWGAKRDALLIALGIAEIGTAVNYRAVHTLSYLIDILKMPRGSLPNAEDIGDRTISLPMYPTLTDRDQERVIDSIVSAWPRLE